MAPGSNKSPFGPTPTLLLQLFIIILLYEQLWPTSGFVIKSENSPEVLVKMPVWARKAGGNWRPELMQHYRDHHPDKKSEPVEVININQEPEVEKSQEEELEENISTTKENEEAQIYEEDDADGGSLQLISGSEEGPEESEEERCPDRMYFHIRGRRCVPLTCPGGNQWRDQVTGECILKRYGFKHRGRKTYGGRHYWRP